MKALLAVLLAGTLLSTTDARAGEARVTDATAHARADGRYDISVTVLHEDTGWDHYADGWEVLTPDGQQLGKRVLMHPHVGEQPFTRSLAGIEVPGHIDSVLIRVHDSVHGYASEEWLLALPGH